MNIRAKFVVGSVERTAYGAEVVRAHAVYSGSAEDNTYAKATPSGSLEMQIDNPAAQGALQPGQSFYMDITPIPAA